MKNILIAVLAMMTVASFAFGQQKAYKDMTPEEQKQASRNQMVAEVNRIYLEEGGKRPKEEIVREYLWRSVVTALNTNVEEKLRNNDHEGVATFVRVYEKMKDSPDYKGVRTLKEESIMWHLAGDSARAQGKAEEAEKAYQRAIKIDPSYATAYYNLGVIYRYWSKTDIAIGYFKKAFDLSPELLEIAKKDLERNKDHQQNNRRK